MELLKQPIVWGGVIFVGVLAAWLKGFLNQFLPAPQRVWLSIKNLFLTKSPRPEGGFRFVLCWLEDDDGGRDTKPSRMHFRASEASSWSAPPELWRALALGEGLPMIGKLLGHTQVQTTARYAHLARDTVKASAARIGDSIERDLGAEK